MILIFLYRSVIIYISMIPNFLISGNKNKGSSLMLPANGLGGSRATILFLFSFLKAAAAPALRALKQAGKKEGGWGEGIFARLCFPRRRRGWGGNAGRNSIRKILWILLKKSSDFNQKSQSVNWRRVRDSNPRYRLRYTRFPSERTRPLCELSLNSIICQSNAD